MSRFKAKPIRIRDFGNFNIDFRVIHSKCHRWEKQLASKKTNHIVDAIYSHAFELHAFYISDLCQRLTWSKAVP